MFARTKASVDPSPELSAIAALGADGPDPLYRERLSLFGQFVGEWLLDVTFYSADGTAVSNFKADWMFSWILRGRGIQDVLLIPPREERDANPDATVKCGTTLRYYDPELDVWRVVWVGAHSNTYIPLIGRKTDDGILLEGPDTDGSPLRWMFSEITPDSFLWTGHTSKDGGRSWYLEQRMTAARRSPRA